MPGGNANLATTMTYVSSWQVQSTTGPNGAGSRTSSDKYGRPQYSSISDGGGWSWENATRLGL